MNISTNIKRMSLNEAESNLRKAFAIFADAHYRKIMSDRIKAGFAAKKRRLVK